MSKKEMEQDIHDIADILRGFLKGLMVVLPIVILAMIAMAVIDIWGL